jgi:regulator of sigma E protease
MLPSFGNAAFTLIAFVVALSVIVAIHEYGHYIVGRWSGIHADVFSIGFGKVLWSRTDKRGTVWQIALLPFGGYVKFKGDGNAASVGADETVQRSRDTMLGAPLWARSATVAAGPVFNFILSMFVFAGLLLFQGMPMSPLTVASMPDLPEQFQGELQAGDTILRIEGQAFSYPDGFDEVADTIPSQPFVTYDIERDGQRMSVTGPQPRSTLVQSITPRSAADDANLSAGDVVLSMDGEAVYRFSDMIDIVNAKGGGPISLEIWRDGSIRTEVLTPRMVAMPQEDGGMKDEPKLGLGGGLVFEPATSGVGLFEALWLGMQQVWFIIVQSLNGLGHMISGAISSCNLSGPVGIAETSGSMASQGLMSFISFIAVLSTAVGLLNLFPIPILDGGHLVFHAYEAVTGKMPSDGALRVLMALGLSLIGTMMLFAIANDLFLCP